MLGTVSQIGQVLLFRELLMIFHGNEISIGLILSAWLVWVGTGSRLGTFLVERLNRPISLLILSAVGVLLLLPLTILTIRVLRGFFEVLPGAYLSLPDMLISCLLLMAPVCLLLGAQFVLLSRIWRESKSVEDTSCGGKAYVGEAVGNMLGGILFTFLMVHHLNSFQSSILAGTLMVAAVLSMGRKGDRGISYLSKWHRHILWGVLGLAILTFPFLVRLDRWAYLLQWRFFSPYHRLVETVQSKYGTISIVQREDQYSFFQSGFLVFTSAGEETVRAGFEEQEAATFAHLSMVQHRKPERILLIGGGLRGTLTEIAKHPVKMIDYIELDEVLTEAARSYISPATLETLADPRVHLIHTDGRLFVKTAKEKYDMIIIDVPDPSTAVLNRYYTKEFFLESKSLLNSDGVLVIGATSTPDLRGNSVANRNTTIYHTLKSVFAHVLPVGERFMFFFATETEGQISAEIPALQKRFLDRNIKTEGFTHHHYHTLLQKAQLRRVNWVVRNHGRSR
ncbi:MAG: spermine synthase, partial [Spirochaetes bacterium]